MINVRLPSENTDQYHISLDENIKSSQWFSQEKNLTPVSYEQKIINSEDVLIFYVNRNFNTISINTENQDVENKLLNRHSMGTNNVYQNYVNSLPLMFSNVQKINDMQVHAPVSMSINGHTFSLRSVVLAESISIADTKIVGETSAIIYDKNRERSFYYNPLKAGTPIDEKTSYGPITAATIDSAKEAIGSNGMIYIYAEY